MDVTGERTEELCDLKEVEELQDNTPPPSSHPPAIMSCIRFHPSLIPPSRVGQSSVSRRNESRQRRMDRLLITFPV